MTINIGIRSWSVSERGIFVGNVLFLILVVMLHKNSHQVPRSKYFTTIERPRKRILLWRHVYGNDFPDAKGLVDGYTLLQVGNANEGKKLTI